MSTIRTSQRCECQSYNRPDWGGTKPEVVLPAPSWSAKTNGICVDECISDAIQMLWANGIVTGGCCCCGHNQAPPCVLVNDVEDAHRTDDLLRENDGRDWRVMWWHHDTLLHLPSPETRKS